MGLVVDLDDAHFDLLADRQHFAGMVDAPPGDVGHMQEAVEPPEVDERTVIGEVLDRAVDDLAFGEVGDDLVALFGPRLSSSTVRRETTMLPRRRSIFRIWNGWGTFIGDERIAHRANVDLAAQQEGDRPVEVDGEAALDLVEDDAFDFLALLEGLLELDPAFLAARLRAR